MKRVAVLVFIALLALGKFSTLSGHWRTAAADQGGDAGNDSEDDEGDDS